MGFKDDGRPQCTDDIRDSGIYCLFPETPCEDYVLLDDICLYNDYTMCINWSTIILTIFLSNGLQLLFESSMYFSLEITYNPTPLEKL
jgi:hypothetical protein